VKKTALVISFSPLNSDARVRRQIGFLRDLGFHVTTIGKKSPELEGVFFHTSEDYIPNRLLKAKQGIRLLCRQYDSYYWNKPSVKCALKAVQDKQFDLYVSNDMDTLPLALELSKNKGKVLFDAHEYAPREFEDIFKWRFFYQDYTHTFCKYYLPHVDDMITVCNGIADEYARQYKVHAHVITNAPPYQKLAPKPINEKTIRMIYHGIALPSRKIEEAIKVMNLLDNRFELDMILIPGCANYIKKIREMSKSNPKIRFIPPVSPVEIPCFCNQYDIGFYPLHPSNYNNLHALPNKFFEFIQARIALAITPLPEMSHFVERYSCGIKAIDFSPKTFATQLNDLTFPKIWQMKLNTELAAEKLCAEENFKIFKYIINSLFEV
jgi:hypothetical protein